MASGIKKNLSSLKLVNGILDGGYYWSGPHTSDGKTIITLNFVGDPLAHEPDATFYWEDAAFFSGMVAYERVANVDLVHVDTPGTADIVIRTGMPAQYRDLRSDSPGDITLASQEGPFQGRNGFQAHGYYNTEPGTGWTEAGLAKGGYGYWTVIHEMGHAMGLAHPHDTGVSGLSPIIRGPIDDSIFTAMSYEWGGLDRNGWYDSSVDRISGSTFKYGYIAGLSPLDIAAVQYLYGANTNRADFDGNGDSNDVYRLPSANAPGTAWTTIWDTGGVDEIRYDGALPCHISLQAFSCAAGVPTNADGSRLISQAKGIYGGFIIADDFTNVLPDAKTATGVIIENASGGSGADWLLGNGADNRLDGNLGRDTLTGGLGADDLYAGQDSLRDTFVFSARTDSGKAAAEIDQILEFHRARSATDQTSDKIDLSALDADPAFGNQAFRFVTAFSTPIGNQVDGQVRVADAGANVNVFVDINGDRAFDMLIQVMRIDTLTRADFIL